MMINTHLMDLPGGVKGLSKQNTDGSYTILLNAKLNEEQQKLTYAHEVHHIVNNDFNKGTPVELAEIFAKLKEREDNKTWQRTEY